MTFNFWSRNQGRRPVPMPFWLALLIVLIGMGGWLGLSLRRIESAYPGLSPAVPLAVGKSYGVNVDLTRYSPSDLDSTLARMSDLGLVWIRQPFPWAEIEPSPGQFDWDNWDQVIEATSAHNLQLIAVLDSTPAWARPGGTSSFTPPTELADFGNFARALAERYQDRLDHYQIWDEPNLSAHWGDQLVDPTTYARLLREGTVNIRAVDADAVILVAALAPTLERGPLNLNESAFLSGLYAAKAAPWFDIVAAQPYGFDAEPGAPSDEAHLNFARVELLRQTMAANGDADKPIWATAFGWSALPPGWSGQPSPWPSLTSSQQTTYTSLAITQARANWPWLGPMFFAAWDANVLPSDDPRLGLALIRRDTLLPQAKVLHDTPTGGAVATVGTYPAQHPSGHYSEGWRLSPAGADVPRRPPATLTIPFEGTRLDLIVRRGDFKGFLYATIDGSPANQLPRQAERAYLVLYDPLEQVDTVPVARYLPDGLHTAIIQAEGGWYQWSVVGWRVSREGDARLVQAGLALVVALAIVAVGGLARSARALNLGHVFRGLAEIETLSARYLALGTPVHLFFLIGTALAFYFVPGTIPSLALLGLVFLATLPRPDLGLALVAFSIPFFLLPKPLVGRTISMTEISLVLVSLACVARRAISVLYPAKNGKREEGGLSWLDPVSWALTGIAALAGLLMLIPLANSGPLAGADWPTLTLTLLPLAGVLAAIAQARQPTAHGANEGFGTRRLDVVVLVLVGLAFVATLDAENFGVSLQEFHVVVWDSAAFYAFVRLIRRPRALDTSNGSSAVVWMLVDALLLGTTLMALYAIYQFFFTDQAITAEGVHRALGVYGSPNNLALLLDRVVPVLIAIAAFPTRGTTGSQMRWRRILYALALVPTLGALALTFSRGALLLGLPASILFIGIVRRGKALWAALGALAAGAIGLLPFLGTERFRSMLDTSAGTGFFRLRLWQSAWAMLRDHPFLGVGLDNFLYEYRTHYILPDAWQEPDLSHPHNILLDFGTRLGVGGIAVLLWLQVAFWQSAIRLYRHLSDGDKRALTLGLMGSMAATLAHGLVDNSFFLVDLAFIFFLTVGIVGRLIEDSSVTS